MLAGVRPEEISEWAAGRSRRRPRSASPPQRMRRTAAIEPVIDQARRLAARGADAVVLIDTLDGAARRSARKALASARNIVDGGSLTVIATAAAPIGGETTVIALDVALAASGASPRSISWPAARCGPSCSSARPGPRRSPGPGPRSLSPKTTSRRAVAQ